MHYIIESPHGKPTLSCPFWPCLYTLFVWASLYTHYKTTKYKAQELNLPNQPAKLEGRKNDEKQRRLGYQVTTIELENKKNEEV